MKEKLFNRMGAFQTATVLKAPNGDSWGDSAMICTLRDMAAFGQLVMNYGTWEGERLMNEKFLRTATSKLVDNNSSAHYSIYNQGYGYQIWRIANNGFAFVGMGDQLTICIPEKKFMFVCTADHQMPANVGSKGAMRNVLVNALYEETGWNRNTVLTYLTRMEAKGLVRIDKEVTPHIYCAMIDRESCQQRERHSFLRRVYSGSAGDLIAAFLKEEPISQEEREKLRKILDNMEV